MRTLLPSPAGTRPEQRLRELDNGDGLLDLVDDLADPLEQPSEDPLEQILESEEVDFASGPTSSAYFSDWPSKWEGQGELEKGVIFVVGPMYLRNPEDVDDIFTANAEAWETETLVVSSLTQAISRPTYRRIIGLGLQAVPLLIARLQETRRYWFPALTAITGENPAEGLETNQEAIDAWVQWGQEHSYLPVE